MACPSYKFVTFNLLSAFIRHAAEVDFKRPRNAPTISRRLRTVPLCPRPFVVPGCRSITSNVSDRAQSSPPSESPTVSSPEPSEGVPEGPERRDRDYISAEQSHISSFTTAPHKSEKQSYRAKAAAEGNIEGLVGSRRTRKEVGLKSSSKAGKPEKREQWQTQKEALKKKFGDQGWNPRRRLSPDALEGIRVLHEQYPDKYTTPVLANQFEVSPEAIRRILKSKWRPSEKEMTKRRERWARRHDRIWDLKAELGLRPKRGDKERKPVSVEDVDDVLPPEARRDLAVG